MKPNTAETSLTAILWQEESNSWLRYSDPLQVYQTNDLAEVIPILELLEGKSKEGYSALGFLSYEAAPAFDDALETVKPGSLPLLLFGVFGPPEEVEAPKSRGPDLKSLHWKPSLEKTEYVDAFDKIKSRIRNGDTYQVNYTYRLQCDFEGEPFDLFSSLLEDQVAPFAAFLETENWAICSVSPELFFKLDGDRLISRPMKGTAGRGLFSEHDQELKEALRGSAKEQAENVMIVDMIRNDMAKIAADNSVEVESLYDIEQYPTVWQMTSSVVCSTDASTVEILKAMYPCASITGAPKRSTMSIIKSLESSPRNLYTGSIGYIGPDRQSQFNVAIRTVLIDKKKGAAEYGIGGGIVWDSNADSEFHESELKSKVLNRGLPPFELLETMLVDEKNGIVLLPYHLKRIAGSASFFGFVSNMRALEKDLLESNKEIAYPQKVRVLYRRDGSYKIERTAIKADQGFGKEIGFACQHVDSSNVFLYHKTSERKVYSDFLVQDGKTKDVVLFNERGEVTESCFANIAIEDQGMFWTPPVSCGLLGGCMRASLIEEGVLRERIFTVEELESKGELYLMNAVRGIQKVSLVSS